MTAIKDREIALDRLTARFQDYVRYATQSDEDNAAECPSTPGQLVFARHLAEELRQMGLSDVTLDANGYLTATLPGTATGPVIGFIAHLDTSPDAPGDGIIPRIITNYDGGEILLNTDGPVVLSPREFPELRAYKGQEIMVTDGTTLLGADDKAGVCAIVSAVEYLLQHPALPHGTVRLAFTPDEETGRSADRFDVAAFGADFAYTVDGGALGGIEYENFNAANAVIRFVGRSVHTGDARGKMRNALTMAAEWQQLLPAGERPEYTGGYEGFYHVYRVQGDVEHVSLKMLVRDHDRARFEQRKHLLSTLASLLNEKYGDGSVIVDCQDVYYNMREKMAPVMYIVELAELAMRADGVVPHAEPIRGGTDGARLSFMGLPCPNLFTGGHNFHGRYEYLPLRSLQKAAQTVLAIICLAAQLPERRK